MATEDQDQMFRADVQAYLRVLPDLLEKHAGEYVVIGIADMYGIYTTREEALVKGCAAFGNRGFIVRRIVEEDLRLVPEWLGACPA